MMKKEHSVRFLYKSFSNVGGQQPDFLSYRLPIILLAIQTDPYFFKVNKIRFKPYGCENETEFIQIQWPILLDELYYSPYDKQRGKGWSGPMFNKWATNSNGGSRSTSSYEASSASDTKRNDACGDGFDSDANAGSSYHRAYIQAEIKPKGDNGFSNSTRGFQILIAALVGGVWELEVDPANYTCKHLAEMRTVKVETLNETGYRKNGQFFYKQVRMLRNYWQCYLAGESNYLVGVNGPIDTDDRERGAREIKELRLYDVDAIPGFIKKCGAEQGFRPWSKEILQNRLYKSLCVIYDKMIDAPVGTEFMFVKYNEFDPPVHDVDGSITGPYLLAFRQLKIEGLPTPYEPQLVKNLMQSAKYVECLEHFKKRKCTLDDFPKVEEKEGSCLILTFENELLAELFEDMVGSYLRFLKQNENFPHGSGMEDLKITKVFMSRPVAPGGNNNQPSQSWRSSNNHKQQSNHENTGQETTGGNNTPLSWRNTNWQHSNRQNNNNSSSWSRASDSASNNNSSQSWRRSNQQQHQQQSRAWNNNRMEEDTLGHGTQSWRSSNQQQQHGHARDGNWRRN